jgi:glycosyltransferase involved in cell wall biosynthesis
MTDDPLKARGVAIRERGAVITDFLGHPFDDHPAAQQTRASEIALGVCYYAPWENEADGFALHSRRNARALHYAGVPVHLRSAAPSMGPMEASPPEIAPLLHASIARYSAQVYQVILNAAAAWNLTTHRFLSEQELAAVNHCRVIYSVWERDRVAPEIVEALNRVGQVWTASRQSLAMLQRSGVAAEKLRYVPMPYFPDDPHLALAGRARKPGVPRFYHIGKWEPRKAQPRILEAFLRAFKPGEAQLWLKISSLRVAIDGFPAGPFPVLKKLLLDPVLQDKGWNQETINRYISVVDSRLEPAQLRTFHALGDVYVSLSRGEGFDIPSYEAKLSGNRLIYTPSGGPQDFAASTDYVVPYTGSVRCHPMYHWELDAEYGDYRVEDAMQALQQAAADVRAGTPYALGVPPSFQAEHVGKLMRANLTELVEPLA